jgi:hypothetical protein
MSAKYEWDVDHEYEAKIAREAAAWDLVTEARREAASARALYKARNKVIEAARRLASTIDIRDCVRGDLQSDVVFAVAALNALEEK